MSAFTLHASFVCHLTSLYALLYVRHTHHTQYGVMCVCVCACVCQVTLVNAKVDDSNDSNRSFEHRNNRMNGFRSDQRRWSAISATHCTTLYPWCGTPGSHWNLAIRALDSSCPKPIVFAEHDYGRHFTNVRVYCSKNKRKK